MNFEIIFSYPSWLVIICLLLGVGYASILYYRNRVLGKKASIALGVIRAVLIFILAVLVLSPMIERLVNIEEEPMILFVQDNTGSVKFGPDSAYYLNEYPDEVKSFKKDLSRDYDVRTYTFGESFKRNDSFHFDEKVTNISDIFEGLQISYSNRNVGAVIIASDGIYNRGTNPVYASAANNFPIYSVSLGDTVPHKDVILLGVHHNQITYLGNEFPLLVDVEARECHGEATTLTVSKDNEELFNKTLNIDSDYYFETAELTLEAEEAGVQRYHVSLSQVEGEISVANNSKDIFIEVLDSRQKVLILSNAPHPDVGAIKQSLENNENYEVESYVIDEFDNNIEQYNLVVFHQLPSSAHPRPEVLQKVEDNDISRLFVIGSQTNIRSFNNLETGIIITPRSEQFNEALADFNYRFGLFSISQEAEDVLGSLPPLFSPFANYEASGNVNVFLNQKIGNVVTEDPLMLFADAGVAKTGIIAGEGIWRWRLHNYLHKQNHDIFDELLSKTTQYLSVLADKSQLRVFSDNIFYENEPVTFSAEVYDHSYELINEPELHLTIYNEAGVDYPFVFSRTSNAYTLDAGMFSVGDYTYEAMVRVGEESFTEKGEFSVTPLNIEKLQTIADHQLMYRLAVENDGKMFYPGQWDELQEEIKQREDIKPVLYSQKKFDDAISLRSIFFLILLLVSVEWFVRKRSGTY